MNEQDKTVPVKMCRQCTAPLLERDKFCRQCGSRQPEKISQDFARTTSLEQSASFGEMSSIPVTAVLSDMSRTELYRRVSGPLVSAMVTGAMVTGASESQSRFLKRVTLALISIPIWLMIVLLSPLDAYAAVKNLVR